MPLLNRLLELLDQNPAAPPDTVGAPFERREIAVVVLLIELAQSDRNLTPDKLAVVDAIVRKRFGLDGAAAARLIAAAKAELDASLEDWIFAKAVRDGFGMRERVEIVELLWEVVYSDGQLKRLEASLMRRVARELKISAADREAARAHAFARMEVAQGASSDGGDAE
jgi:uncharacterized tellurite resistance protein B-like protein